MCLSITERIENEDITLMWKKQETRSRYVKYSILECPDCGICKSPFSAIEVEFHEFSNVIDIS